ncbi:MAG: hypothetical protein C0418_03305 [Coriobacteriaceae bacterium]|nr:hypothetical protein [Coriobacteriaceae bacterium]
MNDEPESTSPRRKALLPVRAIVAAAVVVAVVAAVVLGAMVARRPVTVTVPNVAGLDVPVARSRLAEVGLFLERGDVRFSTIVARDGVIEQSPAPGSVLEEGAVVVVVVSAGSEEFEMPDVVGLRLDAARDALAAKGLAVQVETEPSQEPSDTVLRTLPAPGSRVRTSQTVRLTVASHGAASSALLPYRLDGRSFVIDPAPMPRPSAGDTSAPDVPLEVARRLRSLLEASGAQVTVTRSLTDTDTGVDPRLARARETSPAAVLGLSVETLAKGAAVLVPPSTPERASIFVASSDLARSTMDALTAARVSASQGVAVDDPILTVFLVPGIRIRLGSTASETDAAAFKDPAWADSVARAIYRALGEEFGS